MLTLNKNRDDQKQELQTAQETGIEVDYLQYLPEQKLEHVEYKKYSLSDLSALGVVAEPVVTGIKNILNGDKGTSGIYYVNTKGKEMFKRKDGSGFTATLKGDNGGIDGQAVLNKMPCSPTTIVTAAALAGIEQKLGQIEEMQQEMMDYLKAKEKADLRGNINTLVDIMKNYKFNCDNEQY